MPAKELHVIGSTRLKVVVLLSALLAIGLLCGCQREQLAVSEDTPQLYFIDVLSESGIDFEHFGERHRWCEIGPHVQGLATNEQIEVHLFENPKEFAYRHLIRMNGSGAAWLDYDNDGDWDLYLVNGAGGPEVTNALYENNGDGTFMPCKKASGVLDPGEGMAVSVADFNNDGWSDILVTNFGDFVLYRNNGDKTFSDITDQAFPPIDDRWYGGAAWGDVDLDGDLDLYICGYVDLEKRPQNTDLRFPMDFEGFPNLLYRNNGDGTFSDITANAGVGDAFRKSMQVLIADFNDDLRPDIFVANDTDPNSLYLNAGEAKFSEFSGPSGTSTTDGSMGIAHGDYNNDGKMDLFVSNYIGEAGILLAMIDNASSNNGRLRNAIYNSDFDSPTLLKATWGKVGWGTGFFDFDNDGDQDLFVANGHLNAVSGDNRDENLLFANNGKGQFSDVSDSCGIRESGKRIYRSAAFADYDHDGRVDIYVVNNGEKAYDASENRRGVLLRNRGGSGNHWLKVRLIGQQSNRDGLGSKVIVNAGGLRQVRELVSGSGYFSANANELYFGTGDTDIIDELTVLWPSGQSDAFQNLDANQTIIINEGSQQFRLLANN